ncbi:lytic murein transglycosylase [Mangrovibrevibacter kandeliae]|uniref:lytic murein transglycosylase n=1 Tax=Mangrovibrevibacter kandeliae TaxID=2968473 RepID=UPI00211891E2|nr:lytic murein transglycosylase [Aurantimonas sp. CSK15Z-1]MCQ8783464.1 lytic murein transglycosylase [Aurantimonas sp. CSK15Z-1]
MRIVTSLFVLLALLAALPRPAGAAPDKAAIAAGFRPFLEREIWPEAQRAGVPRTVFDAAFAGVTPDLDLPDLVLPGEPAKVEENNFQAEFKSPAAYFDERRIEALAVKGRALLSRYRGDLDRIERQTGVPPTIILAIWARESGYGAAKIPYNAFRVLGTKAYLSRRKAIFQDELIAALRIVANGHLKVDEMRSSWAGALGQPQFMPSKFEALAVDFDGDGRKDIWNTVPDILASIGHYLQQSGWVRGRDWGFEVNAPESVDCSTEGPDRRRPISAFVSDGVARVSGKPFPPAELKADGNLLMPAGRYGPAFVATPNFYVIKAYNNSDLYALFIGHLADRMLGGGAFQGGWVEAGAMTRGDVARLQEKLQAKGYDVGGADGLPGFKTRRSIGGWQTRAGLTRTCWPSPDLAHRLGG